MGSILSTACASLAAKNDQGRHVIYAFSTHSGLPLQVEAPKEVMAPHSVDSSFFPVFSTHAQLKAACSLHPDLCIPSAESTFYHAQYAHHQSCQYNASVSKQTAAACKKNKSNLCVAAV